VTETAEDYIEVSTKILRRRILRVAYNRNPTDKKMIPCLRFSGSYLDDLGFVVGGHYELTINEDNTITIRALTAIESAIVDDEE